MKNTIIVVSIALMFTTSCYAGKTRVEAPGVEAFADGEDAKINLPGVNIATDGSGTKINVPGLQVITDTPGTASDSAKINNDIVINDDNGVLALVGRGQGVVINGDNNNVVVDGYLRNLIVNGDKNSVDAKETVSEVTLTGDQNTIKLPPAPNKGSFQMADLGDENTLVYR